MSRRFPPPWSVEELAAMSDTRPMTPEQAATLKQLAKVAYELDAFKPNSGAPRRIFVSRC